MTERLTDFEAMWNAYPFPGGSATSVKQMIGGAVDVSWLQNTCVVRLSHCFNLAGHPIPKNTWDEILTVDGRDGLHYALRVLEFRKYLSRRYGAPTLAHAYDPPGGDIPESFLGRRGVICFDVRGWSDATGHFDLWDGERVRHAAYFNRASEVLLWEVDAAHASPTLTGSVGAGGVNHPDDVALVTRLLGQAGIDTQPFDALGADAGSSPPMVAAIRKFQSTFLTTPDGRVDVDGRTFRELLGLG